MNQEKKIKNIIDFSQFINDLSMTMTYCHLIFVLMCTGKQKKMLKNNEAGKNENNHRFFQSINDFSRYMLPSSCSTPCL